LGQKLEHEVRGILKESGVEFLWQSRVKTANSLEHKLRTRSKEYENDEGIRTDIPEQFDPTVVREPQNGAIQIESLKSKISSLSVENLKRQIEWQRACYELLNNPPFYEIRDYNIPDPEQETLEWFAHDNTWDR